MSVSCAFVTDLGYIPIVSTMSTLQAQLGFHPVCDLQPKDEIRSICRIISPEARLRFLTTECGVRRKAVEEMCDLNEEDAFDAIEKHLTSITANEQIRFLESYAHKMQAKTQAMLEECGFLPEERQLNYCIYDLIDAIPKRRRDFLSKIGIASPWKPLSERSLTRRDFATVLQSWWINQANQDPEKLVQLKASAEAFDGDP